MARFERRTERGDKRGRGREGRRDFEGSRRDFERPRGRDRRGKRNSRGRRDFEMTKVTCSSCGKECEVPFKPKNDKPVYCSECYEKREKGSIKGGKGTQNKELEEINKKLDLIIKALKIENEEKDEQN